MYDVLWYAITVEANNERSNQKRLTVRDVDASKNLGVQRAVRYERKNWPHLFSLGLRRLMLVVAW